jgi:Domain of Unknown Function with PDB structure (DUF3857)/Domain of Unknown Function with PDB structure (DUF3858)
MKITLYFWMSALLILLSCNRQVEKKYPDADAVYLNLTKTFVLNKDGSIVNSVEKRQKLLTYRSFQSLYGETRINYNPAFQKLVIKEAYTVNPQNQLIKTPDNGFNDILPAFCLDSKAFSHLREMVVSHTGIERNAVTNCSYNITTEAGKIPFLMGIEELQTECPIEKLAIVIKVPVGKSLHYKLLNTKGDPTIEKSQEFDTYSWTFNDIPLRVKEIRSASVCEDVPTLLFSTQDNRIAAMELLTKNNTANGSVSDEIKMYIDNAIKGKKGIAERALKIQEIVVNELKSIHIPASLVAWQIRSHKEVWQSNSGTPLEKNALLTSILLEAGIPAESGLTVPDWCVDPALPFLLVAEPIVIVTAENGEQFFLSADKLNTGNFDVTRGHSVIIPFDPTKKDLVISKPTGRLHIEGKLTVDGKGTIQGELTGLFSNGFNPYFELIRNPANYPQSVYDFPGTAGKVSAGQSEMQFTVNTNDLVIDRGDLRFIDLKESKSGIFGMHLTPLPFARQTQLNLGMAISESYHNLYRFPVGYHLLNPVKFEVLKPGIGNVFVSLTQTGNDVEVTRKIEILNPSVTKGEYPDFKELIDKWNTQKYRQLVLKKE